METWIMVLATLAGIASTAATVAWQRLSMIDKKNAADKATKAKRLDGFARALLALLRPGD